MTNSTGKHWLAACLGAAAIVAGVGTAIASEGVGGGIGGSGINCQYTFTDCNNGTQTTSWPCQSGQCCKIFKYGTKEDGTSCIVDVDVGCTQSGHCVLIGG